MHRLSEPESYLLVTNDPLTEELQASIKQKVSEPDLLSRARANLTHAIAKLKKDKKFTIEEIQLIVINLEQLLPRLLQPAFLINKNLLTGQHDQQVFTEQPLQEVLNELANLDASIEKTKLNDLKNILDVFKQIYSKAKQDWQNADEQLRRKLLIPKPELTGPGLDFFYIDLLCAQEILCRDAYNYEIKMNGEGIHPVKITEKNVFKPNPRQGLKGVFITPAMERFMFSVVARLSKKRLVAPTTIIKVSHVYVEEIKKELQNNKNAFAAFNGQILQGKRAKQILEEDHALSSALVKTPTLINNVIQVGQTIKGIGFDKLLSLIDEHAWLQSVFPDFTKDFVSFLNRNYVTEFSRHNEINTGSTKDELFEFFINIMSGMLEADRLEDFKNLNTNVRFSFDRATSKISNEIILAGFAFITKWPQAMKGRSLREILSLIKLFECIPTLFPRNDVAEINTVLPNLLNMIDDYGASAHYISTLITMSSDGKADNYMVEIVHDEQGHIVRLDIIGIDMDKGLCDEISLQKKDKHFAAMKSVICFLPIANKPLNAEFRKDYLNQTSEEFMAGLLGSLKLQEDRYKRCLALGVINNDDLFEAVTDTPRLDIPLLMESSSLTKLFDRHSKIYQLVKENELITHQQIFETVNKVLADLYAELIRVYKTPLNCSYQLYNGASIEETLAVKLREDVNYGRTLATFDAIGTKYEDNRTQSLDDAIQLQFIEHKQLDYVNISKEQLLQRLNLIAEHLPSTRRLLLSQEKLNEYLLYAVEEGMASVVQLLIQVGADVNCKRVDGYSPLHIAVALRKFSPVVIETLLRAKNIISNQYDKAGKPAIFYSLHNPALIDVLVRAGCDLEAISRDKITFLDEVIEKNRPQEFIELVNQGAGSKVEGDKAYAFIKHYLVQPEFAAKMNKALLKLSGQNSRVSFLKSLDSAFLPMQPYQPTSGYHFKGLFSGQRYLNEKVIDQVWNAKKEFIRANRDGRHPIPNINNELRLKPLPDAPLVQSAARRLSKLLWDSGELIPDGEIFIHETPKGKIPVYISSHVEGVSLPKVFSRPADLECLQTKLNMEYFTQLFILTLILSPADGNSSQYILVKYLNNKGEEEYKIVCVDDEQDFVDPIKRVEGKRILQVKSIIYCLDHLLRSLDRKARADFLNKDMREVLQKWFGELIVEQDLLDKEFSDDDRERFYNSKEQPVILKFPIAKKTGAALLEKCRHIQDFWRRRPDVDGLTMLLEICPPLGVAISAMHRRWPTAEGRFNNLHGSGFSEIVSKVINYSFVSASKFSTIDQMRSQGIPTEAMIKARAEYSLTQALGELRIADDQQKKQQIIIEELKRGETHSFSQLLSNSLKENILNSIKFSELKNFQPKILELLTQVSLKKLNLSNTLIDDALFIKIIENSMDLEEINISGCPNLTFKSIVKIARECPLLTRLSLERLKQLQFLQDDQGLVLEFPELQYLRLNDCIKLEKIRLKAPRLKGLWFDNCSQLNSLDIECYQLEYLSHLGPSMLSRPQLERLLGQSHELLKQPQQIITLVELDERNIAKFRNAHRDSRLWNYATSNALSSDEDGNKVLDFSDLRLTIEEIVQLIKSRTKDHKERKISLRRCSNYCYESIEDAVAHFTGSEQITLLRDEESDAVLDFSDFKLMLDEIVFLINSRIKSSDIKKLNLRGCTNERFNLIQQAYKKLFIAEPIALFRDEDRNKILDFSGLCLTVEETVQIVKSLNCKKNIKRINLQGCSNASFYLMQLAFNEFTNVEQITFTDYRSPPRITPILDEKVSNEKNLNQFAVGLKGEIYTFNNKRFSRWQLKHVKDEKFFPNLTDQQFFAGHDMSPTISVVLPNGDLVTGSPDKTIRIWNAFSGECLHVFKGHAGKILALAVQGNILISAGQDGMIYHWDIRTRECIKGINAKSQVQAIEIISPDTYVTGTDKGVLCFRTMTGIVLATISSNSSINDIKKVGQNLIASAHFDGRIRLWHNQTKTLIKILAGHKGPVNAIRLLQNDSLLASASFDQTIGVWDLTSGEKINTLKGQLCEINMLEVLPDGSLISGSKNGRVLHWLYNTLTLDLKPLVTLQQPLGIVTNQNSISITADPAAVGILDFCKQVLSRCLPSGVEVHNGGNTLVIETNCRENYQKLLCLIVSLNSRFNGVTASAWNSFKPKPKQEVNMLSRSSNSSRNGFLRGSSESVLKPRSQLPVVATLPSKPQLPVVAPIQPSNLHNSQSRTAVSAVSRLEGRSRASQDPPPMPSFFAKPAPPAQGANEAGVSGKIVPKF